MKLFLTVFTIILSQFVYSQTDLDRLKPELRGFYLDINFGKAFTLNDQNIDKFCDPLIGYSGNSFSWQIVSIGYYFNKYIGIAGNYTAYNSIRFMNKNPNNEFNRTANLTYEPNYYISTSTDYNVHDWNGLFGEYGSFSIGPIIKLEMRNFVLIQRSQIGSIYPNLLKGNIELKENGTNNIIRIEYNPETKSKLYLNTSFVLGYKISTNIMTHFDVNYNYFKGDFSFTKTQYSIINRDEQTIEKIQYSSFLSNISITYGFQYYIGKRQK